MRDKTRIGLWVLVTVTAVLAVGCEPPPGQEAEPPQIPREMMQEHWAPQETPVAHIVRRGYRIREGDVLEVIYHVRHIENVDYRIKIQDVIEVRFPFNPQLHQIEQVQSDGALYLDLIGRVPVFRRTIKEVKAELLRRYSQFIKDPAITVSFKESNVKIAELKKAITTSPRGQSRLVPVTPDGTVSVPFLVSIRAAGKTIEQLHRDLNEGYMSIGLTELEVTVNLQTVAPYALYVLGEVKAPGRLSTTQEITLLSALAQAGSYKPTRAELSKVLLVRRRHLPCPSVAIINVYQLLENYKRIQDKVMVADMGKYKHDLWLEDGDIIYVPTTDIAKRADYIEYVWTRGIRAVGGFTSNYTINDSVDWLGPNP
jgi:polysaccharide export outer membrane protein